MWGKYGIFVTRLLCLLSHNELTVHGASFYGPRSPPRLGSLTRAQWVTWGGELLSSIYPKNQTVCLVSTVFIEPAGSNYALGFLLWSLTPTQAGLASTHTVGYFFGGWRCCGYDKPVRPSSPDTVCFETPGGQVWHINWSVMSWSAKKPVLC